MAPGTKSDFIIYDEEFFGGVYDGLSQNINVFNGASNGTIQLVARDIKGEYEKSSFMKRIAGGLVARRDPTSTAAVVSKAIQQGENVGVKVNRRAGPVEQTRDSWKKIAEDPSEFSFLMGKMLGEEKAQEMVNIAISCLAAAIGNNAGTKKTVAAGIDHAVLINTLALFGDMAQQLRAWVFHSASYFGLMAKQYSDKIYDAAGLTIYQASVATLNRPAIVVDAPALFEAGVDPAPNTYNVLALVEGACEIAESEGAGQVLFLPQAGKENITDMFQAEYAYNAKLKGYAWDIANGGANPTDAALATGANWEKVAPADKLTAGVLLNHQ